MKIRGKTLIIIGVTVICLIGLLHVVATAVITNTVARLEEQTTSQNVDRFVGALSHELHNLNSTVRDYAEWDDTYAFVQDNNTGYIDSNLVDDTFINLRANIMLFVNSTGQIIFGKALDLKTETETPIPESMMEDVSAHDLLWNHETTESSIAGMILLPEGPMLVASRPILTSQGQGPIQGALIMGRFLNSAEMEYLNVTVNLPMTAQVLGDPWLSPDFQAANASLTQGASFSVQALSADTIAGYAMLEDIYGNPILILRIDAPRLIFAQGQATLNMFILLAMLVGLVCAIVTVALLDRFVLSRLSKVGRDIKEIGKRGDPTERVLVNGKDEISDMSSEINNMLSRLAQTEGKLREERDRAQTYLDIAGVMIVALDTNGKVALLNRKGCDILECNAEEARGKNWFDTYLPPKNREQINKIFLALMNGENQPGIPLEHNENPVLTRSGKERLIAWHDTVIKDSDGRIVGTLSSGIDVTERKEAEEALCESELRFRRITETMLDIVGQTDMTGTFQYISPSTKRVLGYEPKDMLGKSILDFVHPDDVDRVTEAIQESAADRSWGRIEFRYKHADGHYLWLDTVGNFLVDDDGKPVGAIFNSRDITERKQLETKLQYTTKRLQTLLETATEGIITADPEENITFVNKAFAEIVGYGENELLNLNARKFLDEEGIRKLEEETQVRKTGATSRYELSMYCKNGEPRIVQLSASPLWNENGTYAGSLGIVTDITERRKVEEALLESQQKFERLFDSNPEAAVFVDANDHVLETNPRFTEVFGYSSEEAKGKALDDLIVPEDKKEEAKALTKESLLGYVFRETIRRTKNGLPVPVLISAAPITIGSQLTGYVVSYRDITERRNMEERLRESEEQFRGIAERSFDAIATVDSKGTITYASPSVGKVLGYPQSEVVGKSFLEYFSQAKLSDATQLFTDLIKGKNLEGLQLELSKTDGTMATIEINASPIILNGEMTGIQAVFRDITQRKKMEEALHVSEERFRGITERCFDIIATIDSSGLITYVSPSVERIIGYAAEELTGKPFQDFFTTSNVSDVIKVFTETLQGKSSEGLAFGVTRKDGTQALVEVNVSPIAKNGEIVGIQGVARDITERKKMEEALQEGEKRFRQVAENAQEWIWEIDSNGLYTYASPVVEEILGYKSEEIVGRKHFYDLFSPEDREELKKAALEVFSKKEAFRGFINKNLDKNGRWVWLSTSGMPILGKEGNLLGYRGADVDITERRRAEEALSESEEKLRRTLESSPDAIILTDSAGKVVECNQATLDMYGFSTKEEAIGQDGLQFISAKDYEKAMESMKAILEKGSARNIEYTLLNKDGKEFLVDVSASVIRDASGEPRYIVAITRDITERKKMEEALRESEEKHRLLFENVNDVVFAYDREFTILSMSPSVEKTLGYKPEELVGRKFQELNLLAPESLETAVDNALQVLGGESISPSVYEFVKKDGTKGFGEITSSPLMREGKVVGVIAVARDITERKQMEERIRESEERLRQFIEFAPDAIYMNDCDGSFLDGNKQAEIMLGYKKEELIGKNMLEAGILPEEYAPKAVELVQKTRDGQRTGPDEMELIRKDGTRIWVEISSMPVKRGDSFEVLGIARDITNRKRIENALHESEEKIRNILQSSPDAIAVTDLNGTMIDCNQEALRLAGASTKEEFLGKNTFDLISPRDYEKSMKNMEILLERGTIRDFEFTLVAKDGREFPAEVSMSLIRDSAREPKYFVATIKNITERKEMLRKLEEYSQQLEEMVEKRTKQLKEAQEQLVKTERLAAIGQVAAMVGHDLRNPLTGIKGAAYYLKTRPALKTDKKTMEMLELIEKDVEYSNKIITDLLEYSRNVHLELTETAPKSIILETLSLLEVPKNVEIINLTQDGPRIRVDIEKLHRVFVNLIKNAFDAMPYGGKMTIKSTRMNDDVEFAFTDTGMGMTKEQIGKLWTPFFTTKAKGMGLGLPICKRIVEAHRGSIKVESMAGLGTTFTVTVPIEPKQIEGGEKIWVKTPESLSLTTTKASDKS